MGSIPRPLQPAVAVDPGEDAFDHPAARQHLEAHLIRQPLRRQGFTWRQATKWQRGWTWQNTPEQLSDKMSDVVQKETMLGLANLCETLAFRHPDDLANRPANDDTKPDA